jgi:hypothetical protein
VLRSSASSSATVSSSAWSASGILALIVGMYAQ